MSRIPLIAGNWKMFKTGPEAVATAEKLAALARDVKETEIMIAPTFLSLPLVSQKTENTNVKTGTQNLFYEKEGAYTGEVSAEMVRAAGAEYVIIGHSERRQYFGETDSSICLKIKSALNAGLRPVLCIGETEKEKDEKKTFSVLDKQIENGLKGFRSEELENLVLAYEPVWAIGTGKTATPEQVNEVHHYIRTLIEKLFDTRLAQGMRILYGGSVKPENVSDLMALEDVDGALVGGASLDADKFIQIIKF
ncbi:MAG: triose-phosphate isomerase [Thermodesulfobacteriota bacterium]|nr:triose-phosphate isomerase [Thermodesulfobacteriota bacterium]